MTTSYEQALELYYRLRPEAIEEYDKYILTRTPAELQADMDGILAPNSEKYMLSEGQNVTVVDSAEVEVAGSPGVAFIDETGINGFIKLTAP